MSVNYLELARQGRVEALAFVQSQEAHCPGYNLKMRSLADLEIEELFMACEANIFR